MRMIDADAVLDRYYAEFEKQDICDGSQDRDWLMRCIEEAPTLTPPEIVCCQDCVHHEDGYAHWCNKWEHTCPDDSEFFCKFGRKKDGSTSD